DYDLVGEVPFWTCVDGMRDDIITEYIKFYPNLEVKKVVVAIGERHNNLQTTLTAGSGDTDVSQVFAPQFPRYQSAELVEDLLQAPFDAGRFKDDMSDHAWNR